MGFIIDCIIIAIIILSTLLAYKKGLAVLAIRFCAAIIAIVITLVFYKPISNLVIDKTYIDDSIRDKIIEKVTDIAASEEQDSSVAQNAMEQVRNGTIYETATNISVQVVNISVILILFFGTRIALRFVTVLADKIAKLPIVNNFNKFGGIIYGIVRGLFIVYATLLLISFMGQADPNNSLHKNVEKSSIGKMMYENNILKILF